MGSSKQTDLSKRTVAALMHAMNNDPLWSGYGAKARLAARLNVTPSYLSKLSAKPYSNVSVDFTRTVENVLGVKLIDQRVGAAPAKQQGVEQTMSNLERALAYYEGTGRWSAATVAAAMACERDKSELQPPQWAELLDQVEAKLVGTLLPKPKRN